MKCFDCFTVTVMFLLKKISFFSMSYHFSVNLSIIPNFISFLFNILYVFVHYPPTIAPTTFLAIWRISNYALLMCGLITFTRPGGPDKIANTICWFSQGNYPFRYLFNIPLHWFFFSLFSPLKKKKRPHLMASLPSVIKGYCS